MRRAYAYIVFTSIVASFVFGVCGCSSKAYSIRSIFQPVDKPVEFKLSVKWYQRLSDRDWFDMWPREISSPAVGLIAQKKIIAAGGRDGVLYVLDAKNGLSIWQKQIAKPLAGVPLFYKDKLFVCDGNGYMQAFLSESGKPLWNSYIKDEISGAPVVFDDKIYFRTMNGSVGALNVSDGKTIWQYSPELPQRIMAFPFGGVAVANDLIVVGMPNSLVVALNKDNGQRIWDKTIDNSGEGIFDPPSAPVVSNDGNTIFISMYDAGVAALSAIDGSLLWHNKNMVRVIGELEYGDMLLVSSPSFGLCALNKSDGSKFWCLNICTGAKFGSSVPVRFGKRVLLSCNRDETGVFVIDNIKPASPPDSVVVFAPGKGVFTSPVVIDDKSFAVISNAGFVYRVNVVK